MLVEKNSQNISKSMQLYLSCTKERKKSLSISCELRTEAVRYLHGGLFTYPDRLILLVGIKRNVRFSAANVTIYIDIYPYVRQVNDYPISFPLLSYIVN